MELQLPGQRVLRSAIINMHSSPIIKEAHIKVRGFDVLDIFIFLKFLHPISRMKPALEKLDHMVNKSLMI